MPAYFDCGFSVRQPMWHGEGIVLDDYPESWDDARLTAGLMWEPTKIPLFTRGHFVNAAADVPDSDLLLDNGHPYESIEEVEGFCAIARDDTGEVLSVPSAGYSVITHAQMGEIIEAVLDADANVKFETAGSCRGGRQVWALAYLDEPFTVPGDDSAQYPFLAFLNSHDGTAAAQVTYTSVRVVCWNTWQMAAAEGAGHGGRHVFRHTGNVAEKIEAAKGALAGLREEAAASQSLFADLAATPIDDTQVRTFTELFLPSPRDIGDQCSDRVHGNVLRARAAFTSVYAESPTTDGIRGTAYGLLQTSTEYLDHVRKARSADTYMGRTLLRAEPIKGRALALIGDITGN